MAVEIETGVDAGEAGALAAWSALAREFAKLGHWGDCVAACDRALSIAPDDPGALSLSGQALLSLNRFDEALVRFDRFLARVPNETPILLHRGVALLRLKRMEEALAAFDAVLARAPLDRSALHNRGVALRGLQRHIEALSCYDSIVAFGLASPSTFQNRANVLLDLKRPEEALADLDRSLADDPNAHNKLCSRAFALLELDRPQEALVCCDQALAAHPGSIDILYNRASALRKLKRFEEALACCRHAIAVDPRSAKAHDALGLCFMDLDRHEEALVAFNASLGSQPDDAAVLINRSKIFDLMGRSEEALTDCEAAIALQPRTPEAWNNRGKYLTDLGRAAQALDSYDRALSLRPDYPDAMCNRAYARLHLGDLVGGFADYEARWLVTDAPKQIFEKAFPQWRGEDLRGKSILVFEEQGLGDTVQFVRYLPLLADAGAEVTFLANAKLHRLLKPLAGKVRIPARVGPPETYDYQCPLLSVPGACRTTLETMPRSTPYLFPEEPVAAQWRARIGEQGFRIGVNWQGNPAYKRDFLRSIPLRGFAPIAAVPGVRLISLQKTHGLDQLDDLPAGMHVETLGEDFDSGPDAFIDTAAVMANLDLVITSDTSIAHVAGALGRPVLLMLSHVADWRWFLDRGDSPWYPTMRLFRQSVRGEWGPVFSQVAAEVERRVRANSRGAA